MAYFLAASNSEMWAFIRLDSTLCSLSNGILSDRKPRERLCQQKEPQNMNLLNIWNIKFTYSFCLILFSKNIPIFRCGISFPLAQLKETAWDISFPKAALKNNDSVLLLVAEGCNSSHNRMWIWRLQTRKDLSTTRLCRSAHTHSQNWDPERNCVVPCTQQFARSEGGNIRILDACVWCYWH